MIASRIESRALDRGAILFLVTAAAIALLVPVLNLRVPASSPFHVTSYFVSLFGKYLCFALLALSIDLAGMRHLVMLVAQHDQVFGIVVLAVSVDVVKLDVGVLAALLDGACMACLNQNEAFNRCGDGGPRSIIGRLRHVLAPGAWLYIEGQR